MKAIEAWLNQGDPATLRKLTVVAEYARDGTIEQWRAVCLAGQTNGCVASGVGDTVPKAIGALDELLAQQAADLLDAYDGEGGSGR